MNDTSTTTVKEGDYNNERVQWIVDKTIDFIESEFKGKCTFAELIVGFHDAIATRALIRAYDKLSNSSQPTIIEEEKE